MRRDRKTNNTAGEAPATKRKADDAPDETPGLGFRGSQDAIDALTALLEKKEIPGADGTPTTALWVSGAPRSGKTLFAKKALVEAEKATGDKARMAVLNAREAGRLTRDVMPRIQAHAASKHLITTVASLAYEVIAESHRRRRQSPPRSLAGIEQDNLIAAILDEHAGHVDEKWRECDLCTSFLAYFAAGDRGEASGPHSFGRKSGGRPHDVFERNSTQSLVSAIRNAFARMDETGVPHDAGDDFERSLAGMLEGCMAGTGMDALRQRLDTQWRLLFALRRAYDAACIRRSAINAADLPMQAASELHRHPEDCRNAIPEVLIVDDAQGLTIAGMVFIQALNRQGCRLVLVGGCDESTPALHGTYPELLWTRATSSGTTGGEPGALPFLGPDFARLNAAARTLEPRGAADSPLTRRDAIAASVAQCIDAGASPRPSARSAAARRRGYGADDDSIHGFLYHSTADEARGIVRQIRRLHCDGPRVVWNDMAVVSEDNATVRRIGEALRRDGIPVRFSSVTKPFAGDPLVEGLLALVKLGFMRIGRYDYGRNLPLGDGEGKPPAEDTPTAQARAECQRQTLMTFMSSPLVGVPIGGTDGKGGLLDASAAVGDAPITRPLRIHDVQTVVDSVIVSGILRDSAGSDPDGSKAQAEQAIRESAVYESLIRGDEQATGIIKQMKKIDYTLDVQTFCAALAWIGKVADALTGADGSAPSVENVLWAAWDACTVPTVIDEGRKRHEQKMRGRHGGKADGGKASSDDGDFAYGLANAWRKIAVSEGPAADVANERLDSVIRLFRFAAANGEETHFSDFLERVHGTEVIADTLATKELQADAVTVTTSTGAIGRHWDYVWVPGVQQGVWPNGEDRATMFASEHLTDLFVHGSLGILADATGHNPRAVALLHAAEKSFLVALTRATRRTAVSCAWDEETVPSDFLHVFLPDWFPAADVPSPDLFTTIDIGRDPVSLHEAVEAARVGLVTSEGASRDDAARALSHLANLPDDEADALPWRVREDARMASPEHWPFLRADERAESPERSGGSGCVTISPSEVDALWRCPVCGMLDRELSGPTDGSVATSFGTLVHTVAQKASQEGWDLPDKVERAGKDDAERAAAIAARMMTEYKALRPALDDAASAAHRFTAERNKRDARGIFDNIAWYFTKTRDTESCTVSPRKGEKAVIRMGRLTNVETEKHVVAEFGMKEIAEAFNEALAEDGEAVGHRLDERQMYRLLSHLSGGFPDGLDEGSRIRIFARIDRLETRKTDSGEMLHRVIDYKTGRGSNNDGHTAVESFNDLQLICYQLALRFNGDKTQRIVVENADLFDVRFGRGPGKSNLELYAQPGLFMGETGRLTTRRYVARLRNPGGISEYTKDLPSVDELADSPEGMGWLRDYFVKHSDTTAYWALGQIAKVFYAAAVINATGIPIPPRAPNCGGFCRHRNLCPACAEQSDATTGTVMGRSE